MARSELLDAYFHDVRFASPMSREREQEVALAYQATGEPRLAEALVKANLRFVVRLAGRYRGYGMPMEDLIQEGNLGLIAAVQRFKPEQGVRLISYAVWWIRAYLQQFIVRGWSLVRTGTTQTQRRLFFKLRSARDALERGGETATPEQIAEVLGADVPTTRDMLGRMSGNDVSLQATVGESGTTTRQALLPDDSPGPEELLARRQVRAKVRARTFAMMQVLDPKERYIMARRLLATEPETLRGIGRVFGISRERVRQIEGKVIRKLRRDFVAHGLAEAA